MADSRLIVNFAPTGMVPTKAQTPYVPLSVTEIVEDVHRAVELGITIAHLHARDSEGRPTYRAEVYADIIAKIRRFAPGLVICVSLSGRTHKKLEERAEPLTLLGDLKPDMGSLTLSSLNFSREASENSPEMIACLASEMRNRGILPELEVFDLGMVNYAQYLKHKGAITPPYYFNIIVGNVASAQLDPLHIATLVRDLPAESYWALGGIGTAQLPAVAMSIALNGGVRIGLEDNLYFDQARHKLATNFELLQRVHKLAAMFERPLMTANEFRQIFGLNRACPPLSLVSNN